MSTNISKHIEMCKTIRKDILTMIYHAKSGHPGGSLSSVELMVGLYFGIMNHNPQQPEWEDRDRFILSKGHVAPVVYSVLARSGYFSTEHLNTLRKFGSKLQGHPNMHKVPGMDSSSGSLGQGLSIANGLAMAAKMRNINYRVYCLLGDGELQEGQVWEAVMTAAHHKLDNICAMVDYNRVQLDGTVDAIKGLDPLADKWKAFNWNVIEIDGHNMEEVLNAYEKAAETKGMPTVIIANTIKGKGVSFMEGKAEWHGQAPSEQQLEAALAEIK
ncbi:transketolase [Petroclostridium sp. X23]|uniref:transketolase n=1 Tax=Petroclostridium sp. X23 TaxID=3045146 RepID=UPI0024AD2697|nr:transketolase [Petroclostridium sp. X23]WHH59201.1 transketolase [Petroclostridium sp. X23]